MHRIHLRMIDVLPNGDHGRAGACDDRAEMFTRQVIGHQEDAIHRAPDDRLHKEQFVIALVVRIGDHHVVAVGVRYILDGAHHGVIERIGDVGDHHRQHQRGFCPRNLPAFRFG